MFTYLDDANELLALQYLEDEKRRDSLSAFIKFNVKSVKNGCIAIELDLKAWSDVTKLLKDTQSHILHNRLRKWLIQEGIVQADQNCEITVESDIKYNAIVPFKGKL